MQDMNTNGCEERQVGKPDLPSTHSYEQVALEQILVEKPDICREIELFQVEMRKAPEFEDSASIPKDLCPHL